MPVNSVTNCSPFILHSMTATSVRTYTILDAEYDVDTLCDVASHGLASGCGGFIYTADNVRVFDENDDEIQDFLSDWYYDCIGGNEGSFAYFARKCEDISQLKSTLVWAYVELKAQSILQEIEHPDFY